MLLVFAHLR